MGLAGATVGVALGLVVQWLLPQLLVGLLPVEVELGCGWGGGRDRDRSGA